MSILITGGCGFLGSNLAARVLAVGHEELAILDNLSRTGSDQNLAWLRSQGRFLFFETDIRRAEDVERVVAAFKPTVVFHLAGQVAMTTSLANPRLDFETNALGTFNVLDAVRRHCPEAVLIYSSTNKVYGDLEGLRYAEQATRYVAVDYPDGFPEILPLEFHSPYGCSKGAADQYVLDAARIYGLRTVVFRHSSMFGGRQFATYDQGWIGWFCRQAVETRRGRLPEGFTISGNGKQVRDVLFADDMVDLYFRTVERIDRASGQAFNIGGGMANSLSLLELFAILEQELDVRLEPRRLPPRASDQKVFVADIRKARELLGWAPRIDKLTGIRRMIAWIEELTATAQPQEGA